MQFIARLGAERARPIVTGAADLASRVVSGVCANARIDDLLSITRWAETLNYRPPGMLLLVPKRNSLH